MSGVGDTGAPPEGLGPADEGFVHAPAGEAGPVPRHWRESCFFVAHGREGAGDALIVTMVRYPRRGGLECYRMGRLGGTLLFARHTGAPATGTHLVAGPASVEVVEPYRTMRLRVRDPVRAALLDLTFTARTRAHALPRGSLALDGKVVWDQRHVIQSGWFEGSYESGGRTHRVERWWGQRDHSWGVREHRRCPLWLWLAIQLPDGMLGVWCWERADGERVYTEGCWAPSSGADPVPVTGFEHDLAWTGADGREVTYGRDGEDVTGLAGTVAFRLAGGRRVGVSGTGSWIARYGRRGGGQQLMAVRTDDGRRGSAVFEITGAHHHRYFPVAR